MKKLRISTLPPFDWAQRMCSYVVWGCGLLSFLFWELSGTVKFTPWRTLSETAWDIDQKHPGVKAELETFLLALVVHIRYRTTLRSALVWAAENKADFNAWVVRP